MIGALHGAIHQEHPFCSTPGNQQRGDRESRGHTTNGLATFWPVKPGPQRGRAMKRRDVSYRGHFVAPPPDDGPKRRVHDDPQRCGGVNAGSVGGQVVVSSRVDDLGLGQLLALEAGIRLNELNELNERVERGHPLVSNVCTVDVREFPLDESPNPPKQLCPCLILAVVGQEDVRWGAHLTMDR